MQHTAFNLHNSQCESKPKSVLQQGFSLLELMVVVLIIGIISAIAIYAFTGQSAKAQVAHCETLLNGARQIVEENILIEGADGWPTLEELVQGGATVQSEYCAISAIAGNGDGDNGGTITATMSTSSQLPGKTMEYVRSNTNISADEFTGLSAWSCQPGSSDPINNEALPKPCRAEETTDPTTPI